MTEIVTDFSPETAETAAVVAAASAYDLVMVGTIEANPRRPRWLVHWWGDGSLGRARRWW